MTLSEKERLKLEQEWKSLRVTNDYIFGRVFSDPDLCSRLIELLLGVKVKELSVPPEYQKTLQTGIESRGVRFDVYTETDGEAFDIEIQTTMQKDLPLRMRYYQSSMDTALIKKGQKFSDLKTTFVLFISTVDQFGYGEPVYEIASSIKNHPEYDFDDRRKELVYNVSAFDKLDNGAVKSFLEYIATGEAKMDFEKLVDEKVEEIKDDEYWKNNYISIQMWKWDAIREGLEKGMEKGLKEGLAEGAAKQKAEDEHLLSAEREKNARLSERITQLEAALAEKQHS